MIIKWIKFLSDQRNQRHGTIHHEVAAAVHFFEWNDVRLNKRKINRLIPEDTEIRQDRAYSYKELEQIISRCDERGKVIISIMISTGGKIL